MAKHYNVPTDVFYVVKKEDEVWRVVRKGPDSDPPSPGVNYLAWEFEEGVSDEVVAHFQFTEGKFVGNLDQGPDQFSKHWTATLDREHPLLRLGILPAAAKKTFHYAVMILGDGEPKWAIGKNPPPKIQVGG